MGKMVADEACWMEDGVLGAESDSDAPSELPFSFRRPLSPLHPSTALLGKKVCPDDAFRGAEIASGARNRYRNVTMGSSFASIKA